MNNEQLIISLHFRLQLRRFPSHFIIMSQTPQKTVCSPDVPPPMSPTHHQLLSTFLFQQTPEKDNDRLDCAICLCTLSRVDCDITETRCNHFFHSSCLDEMKSKTKSQCPICRGPLTPPVNPPRDLTDHNSLHNLDNFYSQQTSLHDHNPHHTTTQTNIVSAARRGREAVQLAIARREREALLNRQNDDSNIAIQSTGIFTF